MNQTDMDSAVANVTNYQAHAFNFDKRDLSGYKVQASNITSLSLKIRTRYISE